MARAASTFQWKSWIVPTETGQVEKAKLFTILPYRMCTYSGYFKNLIIKELSDGQFYYQHNTGFWQMKN